jgi:L-threonylcarbamoyladenylate synthase
MSRQQQPQKYFLSRAVLHFLLMLLLSGSGNFHRISCTAFRSLSQQTKSARLTTLLESETLQRKPQFAAQTMDAENQKRPVKARMVSTDMLVECGARLRQGELVAFPTETVYGLGCNALDESAILKIFEAKERPLTDPLISHVANPEDAYNLWNAPADSLEGKALRVLCEKFWPGPLTLVARAAPHVPALLMANTGFCACRAPQHPVAMELINAAEVPLAAPSANKFGHVSPTRSQHVWDDLLYEDVWIVDTVQNSVDVCDVGVESSVAKLEMSGSESSSASGKITLLRQGAVSIKDIEACLHEAGLGDAFSVETKTQKTSDETVATVAPGQSIRHYSPDIPSFIISQSRSESDVRLDVDEIEFLSKCVIIDFGGKLQPWREHAIAYRDLSDTGDSSQATKSVFEALRWAERVQGADRIIFPEINKNDPKSADALALALKDRLTRAASGMVIDSLR